MKRTIASRWLFLAMAALTLVSQVAVASHSPALHDEAASKCQDKSDHFCAESTPDEVGRCVLCQASVGGIASIQVTTSESFDVAEPVTVPDLAAPRSILKFISAAPRAPPAL